MNIIKVENLSKSYGEKNLFKNISFTVNEGDKIGVIGINGTGKSTLLKIIANINYPDSGAVNMIPNITIEMLNQDTEFEPNITVLEQIFKSEAPIIKLVKSYEIAIDKLNKEPLNENYQKSLSLLSDKMTAINAWSAESNAKTILSKLGITNFSDKMNTLSGGQKKRVALASTLITPCDLLILDEPTNHMDNDTIDWLENYLKTRKGALLMVTHDRYFLDRVVNKTIELEKGSLYSYPGNYSFFIEKRLERREMAKSSERKRLNLYKRELQWMRAGCKARSTKQNARKQRFEKIENGKVNLKEDNIDIALLQSRLGRKIININNISKNFEEKIVIKDFSYNILRNDRIGIIGDNGSGKSTLLNIIAGLLSPTFGEIEIGETVKIGYFSQVSEKIDNSKRAIEYIKETAEFIETIDGTKITASQMMEKFLFTSDMQWTFISKLSGGEKRRLFLLKILMNSPNVLLLDEPTNDLDIDSLNVLEAFIDDFSGVVIAVSHDRYFLDRTCQNIFAYKNGQITQHNGNYSDYKRFENTVLLESCEEKIVKTKPAKAKNVKLKFTYKEKLEFESIEAKIEDLENKIKIVDKEMLNNSSDFEQLSKLQNEKSIIENELLDKMERYEYLYELNEKIENQN
ncbi:ABC-F family ATP-binding cassette domain-containing protein [Helicovermis profundi]|uniref:ABC-F family ATP-binding cassette domain-containing protein n=1 Tax=Helicovermis profundi TaxID=3065157 RepID=A0AAU9E1F9_9FIRM|nr:ABC-F family ATP-binding cassette domain-containing protein [Clostridia bacterium S502]